MKKLPRRVDNGPLKVESKNYIAVGRLKERYPRVARYHKINYGPQIRSLTWEENEDRKEKAKRLDGG